MWAPQSIKKGIAHFMAAVFLCVTTTLVSVTVSVEAARDYSPPEECGLYLAPSAINGAGLGMYTGSTGYEAYSLVSDSDIMLPTWDLDYHNGDDDYDHLWDEYTWSGGK